MNSSFQSWMKARQADCESALQQYLPSATTTPARLHQAMRYASLEGGKRVRPLLVYAAGAMFEASPALLDRAAVAVELIHAYSLVHDDMPCMDNDVLRRGKPTVHVQYDEATALLVGDALQAQAFQILAEADAAAEAKLAMLSLLARAAGSEGMCGGQAIDLASVGLALQRAELEQMHRLKTGAILRASVFLGALAGKQLTAAEYQALDAYAAAIGLAFQVVDDVLDAVADSATLGKTAGKDAAQNKPTYVSLMGLAGAQQLARDLQAQAHAALAIFADRPGRHYLLDLADLVVQRSA